MKYNNNTALIIVDIQNDFLPGGALGVNNGNKIISVLNESIKKFETYNLPIFFTRDWHPSDHSSFSIWPIHCVQDTWGAQFSQELYIPKTVTLISKATQVEIEAYSGFKDTDMHHELQSKNVQTLVIAGIATDYCVLETVLDACQLGYRVFVLKDGIASVNLKPNDEQNAINAMKNAGAHFITMQECANLLD